tara:strand:- start:1638 stop:1754 length:117 start_codon:yes stop_codon:yes gene_type:complete
MNCHLTRSIIMKTAKTIYKPSKATRALLKSLLKKGEVK